MRNFKCRVHKLELRPWICCCYFTKFPSLSSLWMTFQFSWHYWLINNFIKQVSFHFVQLWIKLSRLIIYSDILCIRFTWFQDILYNIMLDVSSNEFCKAISVGIQGILRIKKWNLSYRFEYWYWLVSYQSSYQKLSCHCWPSNRRQEACNVIKYLTGECILTAHFLQPTL